MKAYKYDERTFGMTYDVIDIPDEFADEATLRRERLIETLTEYDDGLMQMYLDGSEIGIKQIKKALRRATLSASVVPVLCGAALKNTGVQKVLDAIVDYLPSPLDIPAIEGFDPKTNAKKIRKPSDDEPFSALAFKIMSDPFVGRLTYLRIYSGKLETGASLYNAGRRVRERVAKVLLMHANKREEIDTAFAGDIVAVVGLKKTYTGDTLSDPKHPIVFESMVFPEPVISVAIEPKTRADQEKLGEALERLADEDPTFKVKVDEESGQTIVSGMGELHLEVIVDRMIREFGVKANVGKPQVAYRETITQVATGEGKFVKPGGQGSRGQYGHVVIRLEPLPRGSGFAFQSEVGPETIPDQFVSAIEQGIAESLENGVLAGYRIVDIKAVLIGGSYHESDSNEVAYKIATAMAFRNAIIRAKPIIMEPVMKVEVVVPEEFVGDVIADLGSRRGKASVPLSEMFGYATGLRSATQGRALFTMEFSHYEEVPKAVAEKMSANIEEMGSYS
jgi:elongation factor G